MNDLISRQAVIQMFNVSDKFIAESLRLCNTDIVFSQNEVFIVDDMYENLEQLPSVQERKGHWIDMGDFEQCSVCTGTQLKEFQTYYGKAIWIRTPYCPNCGAKMEAEHETN